MRRSFFLLLILVTTASLVVADDQSPNIQYRGSLINSHQRFEREKRGHVAFLGGSITEMNGYRPMVCDWLQQRFPETQFTFRNAGISSTCSTTGAFRLHRDVLNHGPVDLLFVEFAVNDDQDAGHTRRECIRGMEGIVRQARAANPFMDVVFVYFVNPEMLETLRDRRTPLPIASHESVALHYEISSIHLAREVAQQINAGTLTWEKYGGTHPSPAGNRICADMVAQLLTTAWKPSAGRDAKAVPHTLPAEPLDHGHYGNGRFVDPATAHIISGWKLHVPDWKNLPGQFRDRFADRRLVCARAPGAELTLEFNGTAVGAYILAGPDAGTVTAAIDGGKPRTVDLYHRYSRNLHYPRTVIFGTDLPPGRHTLHLRVDAKRNPESTGHAVRVLQFVAN